MRLARGVSFLVFVCAVPLCSSTPLHAQQASGTTADASSAGLSGDEEARMRFELGRRYYDTGRFAEAAREFAEAHRLSGRAELLYNLFLAYRDAGDDANAAATLRAYLPSLEQGERRLQLEARLRVLEQRIASGTGGADTIGTGEAAPENRPNERDGSSRDPEVAPERSAVNTGATGASDADGRSGGGLGAVPWVVLGVGGALVVASVITGALALDARASLGNLCAADRSCPPGYESMQSSGQTLAITTDVLWITGGLAVGTGVVLAVLDATSGGSARRASIGGVCTGEGCLASVSGRF